MSRVPPRTGLAASPDGPESDSPELQAVTTNTDISVSAPATFQLPDLGRLWWGIVFRVSFVK
jgi:hypothetical protein